MERNGIRTGRERRTRISKVARLEGQGKEELNRDGGDEKEQRTERKLIWKKSPENAKEGK